MSSSKAMESPQLSEDQLKVLENCFNRETKHPEGMTLMLIAAESGLSEEQTLVRSVCSSLLLKPCFCFRLLLYVCKTLTVMSWFFPMTSSSLLFSGFQTFG